MKFNVLRTFISAIVLLLSNAVFGQTQVPNTFQAGQPARAAEVNANFSELESAVNQNANDVAGNAADIAANTIAIQGTGNLRVLDGGDNLIGYLVNISDDARLIDVLTEQGYVLPGLAFGHGQVSFPNSLLFPTGNCAGQPFTALPNGIVTLVYEVTGVTNLYYAEKNSIAQIGFVIGSVTNSSGCFATPGSVPFAWLALPNDPAITGVSSQTYTVPIKIELAQ